MIDQYFEWLLKNIGGAGKYLKLFQHLYSCEFTPILPLDLNQSINANSMRYEYSQETGLDVIIPFQCSILELMIYCAKKIEDLMRSSNYIDRTGEWFYDMIVSLGLDTEDDDFYDPNYVDYILDRFNKRKYLANGAGGLFFMNESPADLTKTGIWTQLMWKCNELLQTVGY